MSDHITSEEAVALQAALGQLQTALDVVVRERAGLLAEVERLREALKQIGTGDSCTSLTSLPPICARAYEARRIIGEKPRQ